MNEKINKNEDDGAEVYEIGGVQLISMRDSVRFTELAIKKALNSFIDYYSEKTEVFCEDFVKDNPNNKKITEFHAVLLSEIVKYAVLSYIEDLESGEVEIE